MVGREVLNFGSFSLQTRSFFGAKSFSDFGLLQALNPVGDGLAHEELEGIAEGVVVFCDKGRNCRNNNQYLYILHHFFVFLLG